MQDPILFWNEVALDANREDHTGSMIGESQAGPTRSSRAICLVHLAMHDAYFAVNGVLTIPTPTTPKALYLASPPVFGGVNGPVTRSAAVSGAAATMLATLYSVQRPFVEAKAAEICASNGTDDSAFEFGRRIATAILALRGDDDKVTPKDEDHASSPGKFRHRKDPYDATQPYLGVAFGKLKTFAVSAWQPLAAPPTGPAYDLDLKEVAKKGGAPGANGTNRTGDETMIGYFWAYDGPMKIGTPPRLYNQILREVAKSLGNTEVQNARLFALVNCAMGDSGVHAWHYKYCYDLWRPVVGVREADQATGPAAVADPAINAPCDPYWRPLGAPRSNELRPHFTPPFPAYPSGHATFGAAAFEAMRLFYRDQHALTFTDTQDDAIGFQFVSDEQDGRTRDGDGSVRTRHWRKFSSLATAMYENSVSRIFLGVHWRFDGTTGTSVKKMLQALDNIGGVPLGRAIAQNIFTTGMRQQGVPPTAPTGTCL